MLVSIPFLSPPVSAATLKKLDPAAEWYVKTLDFAVAVRYAKILDFAAAMQYRKVLAFAAAVEAARDPWGATGSVNGYPCGGRLPTCEILRKESGGNPRGTDPRSSASGLWAFIDSTWAGFGGYRHAKDAPVSVQNQKAAQLWDGGRGCRHWTQTSSQC